MGHAPRRRVLDQGLLWLLIQRSSLWSLLSLSTSPVLIHINGRHHASFSNWCVCSEDCSIIFLIAMVVLKVPLTSCTCSSQRWSTPWSALHSSPNQGRDPKLGPVISSRSLIPLFVHHAVSASVNHWLSIPRQDVCRNHGFRVRGFLHIYPRKASLRVFGSDYDFNWDS